MEGTYKYQDCTIINPIVTIYDIGCDLSSGETKCACNMTDPADNTNGCSFGFKNDSKPDSWTLEDIQIWVENYLQKYKV